MKKMGKVLEKKVEILREGGSVTMSHKLLEDLREVLSPMEYKNLCFVGGGAFIENLKEIQDQEKTVGKEEKKMELKVHTKAKLIKIIQANFSKDMDKIFGDLDGLLPKVDS
ncbi:MAG: hypothetical protein ACRCZ2_12840, partial [Fusobacteriaceae bacterium]